MQGSSPIGNDFLRRISDIIQENMSDEMFGVSELASEAGMSRSNLLRKIKKLTKTSASQYIRQIRLRQAMEMLSLGSLSVSEIAYSVGFSSVSYFIKCFREYYGYPPGEAGKIDSSPDNNLNQARQLAAIMFTDIQGYTALMQRDEVKAVEFRNRHREVFNAITRKYNGRILQYYGDGTLSTFSSAIDAVYCGIEMQMAFRLEPQIPVRIGIHTGDIIVSKEEIIGDGVNIASRIESLATVGSIFISEKVFDEVKNQSGIQTTSVGIFELKNVDKPVEVFAITNPGLAAPDQNQPSGKLKGVSSIPGTEKTKSGKRARFKWATVLLVALLAGYVVFTPDFFKKTIRTIPVSEQTVLGKSIAVLPFINDSNDSTNVYIINGLMEAILNNLQKIEDLRVISRTSVEKYRNQSRTIPELAGELNVHYFVEGSGQKIGNRISLTIQLIEAPGDRNLWSETYEKEVKDIFTLQTEVAKNIAERIQAVITPEEEKRISKPPTENLAAYDYFLKGLDMLNTRVPAIMENSITYFNKAIEEDPEFARAYAAIAMAYYFLDENQADKKYTDRINHYADQALLFDDKLPQSLIAKALFYMTNHEYVLAGSYFEKALEYNPNADLVYAFLANLYANYLPDTEKYLEYGLRGINIDITSYDSVTTSFIYLHISNAFIQSGFIQEAVKYIDKSLSYYPENLYSEYTKAYILYAKNQNLQQTKTLLWETLHKDSTRYDIIQKYAEICYYTRDYENAFLYYKKLLEIKERWNLDVYNSENAKIGFVFSKMGYKEKAGQLFSEYKKYAENDQSIYKHLSLAAFFSYQGDEKRAIEHLRLFANEEHYWYWVVIFIPIDPLFDPLKDQSEFRKIMNNMKSKFWKYHEEMKISLKAKELI